MGKRGGRYPQRCCSILLGHVPVRKGAVLPAKYAARLKGSSCSSFADWSGNTAIRWRSSCGSPVYGIGGGCPLSIDVAKTFLSVSNRADRAVLFLGYRPRRSTLGGSIRLCRTSWNLVIVYSTHRIVVSAGHVLVVLKPLYFHSRIVNSSGPLIWLHVWRLKGTPWLIMMLCQ